MTKLIGMRRPRAAVLAGLVLGLVVGAPWDGRVEPWPSTLRLSATAYAQNRPPGEFPLVQRLNGSPQFLGVIQSTGTSKNNHDTTTPFNNTGVALKGKVLLLQPDAAGHVLGATANNGTVTTANGVKLGADERVIVTMMTNEGWLTWISSTGTTNLRVWEIK